MFENLWDIPCAITRRIDLDPEAPLTAIKWTTAQMASAGATGNQGEDSNQVGLTWAGIWNSEDTSQDETLSTAPDEGDRYRKVLAKVNELKKADFARFHSTPLVYVPTINPPVSEIDSSMSAFLRDNDAFVSSWQTLGRSRWEGGPILAIWPDERHLADVADDPRTTAICVIPSKEHDISAWCYGVKPQMLKTTENELWGEHGPEVLDPVVVEALSSLTVVINVSSKLVSDIDRVNAIQAFRLLWDGGHNIVPVEVHAWALANGWPPKGAYSLREIAERVAAGRTFVQAKEVGVPLFDSASLRTWRERARARFIPRPSA